MSTGQMHPDMHPIDDDLVRLLIAGQFPQWSGLAVERFRPVARSTACTGWATAWSYGCRC
ncbi:hypothetical protein [Streptomyces hypolithicus]